MKKRLLGKTGLYTSEIGVGCWAVGGATTNLGMGAGWDGVSEYDVKDGLFSSIELGANFFDTANVYGLGKSERTINLLWKEKVVKREEIIIASKLGYFQGCGMHGYEPLNMRQQLEMSLSNLKTDYIDVYFFHHLDFGKDDVYLDDAIDQMLEYKKSGKIRFIGLRGPHKFSLLRKENISKNEDEFDRFMRICNKINPDVIGIRYNMISQTGNFSKKTIFEYASNKNIGIVTYKTLGQGLLLDKYNPINPPVFSEFDHRSRKQWYQKKGLTILKERIEEIKKYFGVSSTKELVEISIAYSLNNKYIASSLVGFKTKAQITESLNSSLILNDDEILFINKIFDGVNDEIGDFIVFN